MTRPAVLVHNAALLPRLSAVNLPDCRIVPPEAIADGVSDDLAASVEVLVSAGEPLPNSLVDALPRLKLVACFATGYAGIDLAHLRARGIRLTTAAGVNAHDVADHAVALLLGLQHGVIAADRAVREGGWRDGVTPRPSLRGQRVGIVGLGRIGLATAMRLSAHEMDVRWWGPREKPDAPFARSDSLATLAHWSQVLILTGRADARNTGQINAEILHLLGPAGFLVNVSRGTLVDEDALIAALTAGTIAGAALDVFCEEPVRSAAWSSVPNVVLSPHLGGYTQEAGREMGWQLHENVRRYLCGEPLLTPTDDVC